VRTVAFGFSGLGTVAVAISKRDASALRHLDHGDAAKNFTRVSTLIATVTPALDEALSLVEVEGRDSDAAASGHFANGEGFVDFSGCGIRHYGPPS